MDYPNIRSLFIALAERGANYALVGSAALNVWGIGRTTADVQLFLPTDAKNLERVKDALRTVWNDPEIESITVADLAGDGVVRYVAPDGDLAVDLFTRAGEKFQYDNSNVHVIERDGVFVRVAAPEGLVRMENLNAGL